MSRTTRALTPARRDAGLRRLRTLNRILIAAAVVLTGLLTDVAAKAFPGHKRTVRRTAVSRTAGVAATTAGRHRHRERRHRHSAHHALSAPAQAPTSTAATTAAPQGTAPAAPAPAPAVTTPAPPATGAQAAPAPAPVVSGGS